MADEGASSWSWPDALAAAVSLSYDGSLLCHLETAVPHLERFGFHGTFYARADTFLDAVPTWKRVQASGHEIGNGCLFSAAIEDGSLPAWSPEMISADIADAEDLLSEALPHQRCHSFAYPCGQPRCSRCQDYREVIESFCDVARSGIDGFNAGPSCDLTYLKRVDCNGLSASEMISMIDLAIARGEWAILAFSGVGVGNRAVDAADHLRVCEHLDANRSRLWIDPVISVASRLRAFRTHRFHLV